jgi:arginyl-tRNA synthetase
VQEIIAEKNPDLSPQERDEAARQVSLGALAYTMLSVDTKKDIVFDWDRALDFEGQAAPYIQYAHVRANSILQRAGEIPAPLAIEHTFAASEIQLLDRISRFPDEVQRAAEDYKPLLIANYAYDLARDFTDFYQHCPVLKAEGSTRAARLRLTAAAKQVLANSLYLLNIKAPDVM